MNAKLQHAAIAIPNITPIPIFICHLFPSQCANPTITAYINSIESTTASTCTTPNLVLFIRYVDHAIVRITGTTEIIAISITVKTFIVNIENFRALSFLAIPKIVSLLTPILKNTTNRVKMVMNIATKTSEPMSTLLLSSAC